ncbi:MAG: biotin-dependent carboxyltransferase family protein [Desulfobulbus sp.]|uniref:5-oxoprolinase subunit C family protein n=1 Tax=Desulfobulbus sp. TaxID=895 RepID=UPI002850F303|nr:biotin-dependent carboxyltransferase family protein [Desulfobulbus sp.]MDR2550170.1 biotin-dependent carboxyltransferase family protein [Desulfobulbus sp.]
MSPALRILAPGLGLTVQDLGRFGALHLGVPPSGALDDYAHRVANWLVGNPTACATLEMTVSGPRIECLMTADIAVTGAAMGLRLNGSSRRQWASLRVRPGDVLELGLAENGCRGYLALTGGIAVPEVMGSRSTCLAGGLGGLEGRLLARGDLLPAGRGALLTVPRRLPWTPIYPQHHLLRAIPGPHDHLFAGALDRFFETTFAVSPRSDRMGLRLSGPAVERDAGAPSGIVSEPVVPGTVQVPGDGQPILLLREQTIGGYACIATVLSADLWRIGQVKPGDTVRFVRVDLETGWRLAAQWQDFLATAERLLAAGR